MRKLSTQMLSYVCGALLVTTSLIAQDPNEAQERHMAAGDRSFSLAEYAAIQERRAAEPQVDSEDGTPAARIPSGLASALAGGQASSGSSIGTDAQAATNFYITTHAGSLHWPVAVGILGEKIELEDGSVWAISAGDCYKTLNWLSTDMIVITPNHAWFSSYAYRLNNQNTGASVEVNLSLYLNPVFHTVYNHVIVLMDDLLQMIWLEDGSCWSISAWDYTTKWMVGDTVIIGINDGILSSSRPNILINANLLQYVRCNCIN
jgi:hypothetical protein